VTFLLNSLIGVLRGRREGEIDRMGSLGSCVKGLFTVERVILCIRVTLGEWVTPWW